MKRLWRIGILVGIIVLINIWMGKKNAPNNLDDAPSGQSWHVGFEFGEITKDEKAIRKIHQDYVDGWKTGNEKLIMSLFEDNAMIQPNTLNPISGKENISSFWFPKDGAITTHSGLLDWNYQNGEMNPGRIQKRFNTTIYRKQDDGQWKIWRSMWTDIASQAK